MKEIKEAINQIKETKPLILNLTNFVTMDFVANCLLVLVHRRLYVYVKMSLRNWLVSPLLFTSISEL